MAPSVSLSLLQQGQQITRNDYSWTTLGTPADVTFGFRASTSTIGNEAATFGRFNPNEVLATRIALQEWTDVANIRFIDAGGSGFTDNATTLFATFNGTGTSAGHAYLPVNKNTAPTSPRATLAEPSPRRRTPTSVSAATSSRPSSTIGPRDRFVPSGDYNAGDEGVPATYQASPVHPRSAAVHDHEHFFCGQHRASYLCLGGDDCRVDPGPRRHHRRATLYGAAMTTRTGDNIYGFNSNSAIKRISDVNPQVVFTIYDNGGINMLDLSGYATNQAIDLRQGEFSNAGALIKNISIAPGTIVQNARGGSGNDAILANGSDNAIQGGPGNDLIDGGAGINTAFYSGASGNYIVTLNASTGVVTATVQDKTGVDGTDIITNIQHLRFADALVTAPRLGAAASLSEDAPAAASSPNITDLDLTQVLEAASLSPAAFSDLAQVFIATLERAPDALGLDYWAGRLVEGTSLREVAASIAGSAEARALLPATLGAGEFVAAAYNLTFGRAPDAAGLAYWQGELQSGHVSRDMSPNSRVYDLGESSRKIRSAARKSF